MKSTTIRSSGKGDDSRRHFGSGGFFPGKREPGNQSFQGILEKEVPFGITSLIFQEILQGAKSEKEYETLRVYLSSQRFFHPKHPIDSYAKAARIYFLCRKRGIRVRSSLDCLIAQVALENELLLLNNDRDFDAMAPLIGLRIYPGEHFSLHAK
ncbi:MAG: type II toxin-antitoxin system VapC family toxin [Promethearchaeota archaeon]